jgi:hemolysin III
MASMARVGDMARKHRRFSIIRFLLLTVLQVGILFFALQLAAPGIWRRQFEAGPLAIVLIFVGWHLFLSFFEWFFHRYVLHFITISWLRKFASEHRLHHSLTAVRLRPASEGSDRVILNEYPITQEEQFESSAFPFYSLTLFWLFFTPLVVGLQLLWPHLPFLLGGYAAIAWSMGLYEVLHAIDHWPYGWWRRAIEHRIYGPFWRRVYGFHLMHHANVSCNESISGFFSLPVPDWCFGTYHQPEQLLLEGRKATAKEFTIPPPYAFVRKLDRWARGREARSQRRVVRSETSSQAGARTS